jgi:hypothetical protein
MRKRYQTKESIKEETGRRLDWKTFKADKPTDIKAVEAATRAIQFGNSVSDNERAYILNEMVEFLAQWKAAFPSIDLFPVGWSFGARGRAGSVAHFEPTANIISMNRDRIGSLVHELGHYIDYKNNQVSRRIPYHVIAAYRVKLEANLPGLSPKQRSYYLSREEVFARAFEAYCQDRFKFCKFAADGAGNDWPELCPELIAIIESVLN